MKHPLRRLGHSALLDLGEALENKKLCPPYGLALSHFVPDDAVEVNPAIRCAYRKGLFGETLFVK